MVPNRTNQIYSHNLFQLQKNQGDIFSTSPCNISRTIMKLIRVRGTDLDLTILEDLNTTELNEFALRRWES